MHDDSALQLQRRRFLVGAGGAAAIAWLGTQWPSIAAAHGHAATASADGDRRFTVLGAAEARDVEAIAAQIIPTDHEPGAREAGVVWFVDRSLATWAASEASFFLGVLRAFRSEFALVRGGGLAFADVDSDTQIAELKRIEKSELFGAMRMLTLLGMFALPSYGGNRDGVGWKLLGFEDGHAFSPPFGHYDRDYPGWRPVERKS